MKIPASQTTQNPAAMNKAGLSHNTGARLSFQPGQDVNPADATANMGAPESLSPSERLSRYSDHMLARLDALEAAERSSGLDLSAVRSAFEAHIAGLQDSMRRDGLSGDALAQGIQAGVDMVRDGVRDALGMPAMQAAGAGQAAAAQAGEVGGEQTDLDIDHSLGRLDAMESRIRDRMDLYLSNLAPEEHGQFHEASDRLDHSFGRLRDALSTGQMSLEDVRRSLANIMDDLREDLAPPSITAMTQGQGPATQAGAQGADSVAEVAGGAAIQSPATQTSESGAAQAANSQAAAPSAEPAWAEFLSKLEEQQEAGLAQLWKSRPPVQSFLMGLQQDARQAQGLDMATYGRSAQLQSARPDAFGGFLDLAV